MHLLEDHALDFIKSWGSGFGLYGEQGMESLHASFNSLKRAFGAMKSPIHRLKSMLKEHYGQVNPDYTKFKKCMEPKQKKTKPN